MRWIAGFLCLFMAFGGVIIEDRMIPMPRECFFGQWSGYEHSAPDFYSMHLREDGTGSFVIIYPQSVPDRHSLSWFYTNGVLVVHEAARGTGEKMFIQPQRFDDRRMLIKISGITNRWTREAWLFNDKELLTNISQSAHLHSQQESAK